MGKAKPSNSNANGSGEAVSGLGEEGGVTEEIKKPGQEDATYPKLLYSPGGGYAHAYNFNQERDLKAQGFGVSKVQW